MKYIDFVTVKKGKYKGRKLYIKEGLPLPFGATTQCEGVNFSVYSHGGKKVSISFFDLKGEEPFAQIELDAKLNKTGDMWHALIVNLPTQFQYAFHVSGTYDPKRGLYFNDKNILLDPYAKALSGGEQWGKLISRGVMGGIENRRKLRRGFIPSKKFDWENDKPINRPLNNTIMYELHVRGFTINKSSQAKYPGTFKGIIEKIPHLKELGITAVELMPINEFDENECMFTNPVNGNKLNNYWGYSSLSFFAPKSSYAFRGKDHKQVDEFKEMVKALHKAGIEIILDVVFNHTAEGNEYGPTLCYRGLENNVYYMMDENGGYKNYSGCGNTLNCNHPVVRELILDCLRYWVMEMHVDGFRFDLASILGRDQNGNVLSNPPILEAITHDPILSKTKIIAEAWDAAGLYQVGQFPAWKRWAEWNDKYRDCVRRFLKGDTGMAAEMATRIAGSSDLYGHSGRKPYHSINYYTCHDGFTLYDLVAYNDKHNIENGENNRDGISFNHSWNCGAEGETSRTHINKLRIRQMKNFIALLMISQGTPLLLAGDEFGRTQKGNNNAYCQDNEISWISWDYKVKFKDVFRFMKEMIHFRKVHSILRRDTFFTGEKPFEQSFPDISWHSTKLHKPDFTKTSKTLAFLISGNDPHHQRQYSDVYVALNPTKRQYVFKLPNLYKKRWHIKVDTSHEMPEDIYSPGKEPRVNDSKSYPVKPHSIIILISK